jgi:hypothetical protein
MMATFFELASTLSSLARVLSTKCAHRMILSHSCAIVARSSSRMPALNASYAPASATTPRRARATSHPHPLARITVAAVVAVVANLLARAEARPARASRPRFAPRANERDDDEDANDAGIARVRPRAASSRARRSMARRVVARRLRVRDEDRFDRDGR